MISLNKVTLIGQVKDNPEARTTQSGSPLATFRVVVLDKAMDGRVFDSWYGVVVFGKQAEGVLNNIRGGMTVIVEGSLSTRKYENRDGQTQYVTEIRAIYAREMEDLQPTRQQYDDQSLPPAVEPPPSGGQPQYVNRTQTTVQRPQTPQRPDNQPVQHEELPF